MTITGGSQPLSLPVQLTASALLKVGPQIRMAFKGLLVH
jgi:hypothetical protein